MNGYGCITLSFWTPRILIQIVFGISTEKEMLLQMKVKRSHRCLPNDDTEYFLVHRYTFTV